ncbi:SDR family NAD(P)-dependent oxidoreductase [Faecalibacter sp. LW9]|uniref:SDR family NAD(P)-dependent oxidoreductase n=1 Tax=Faecalibacter sp. LW9 TaxID=3103144 RepID=UPI002AFE125E|nr:SDR family NAD(P)-dependent oxidoreductase [Faecalibacter sp. LW9]
MKYNFKDKVVLITGSASGIGKIMSRKVLEKGAKEVVMLDYNLEGIQQVKQEFAHFGKTIHTYQVDLSQQDQVLAVIEKVKADLPKIDVLINNAGVIVGKYYTDHTVNDINYTMDINTIAVMLLANAFMPDMVARNEGVICNIASMAGLTSTPKMAAYVASKWAVVGFSETLWLEMKQQQKNVIINCVMPFYINTGMFDGVKSRVVPILDPEKVATKIISNIEKGKFRTPLPLPYWFIRTAQALMPNKIYDFVMGDIFGIYDSMEDFKGRTK